MQLIHVNASLPLALEDATGRVWRVYATPGVYHPIPVEVYRRWRWLGELQRPLVRADLRGRTFLRDTIWSRLAGLPKPVVRATETKMGCGCRGRG